MGRPVYTDDEAALRLEALARALGVASVVSGLALLVAPRPIARVYGLPARFPWLVRALGARDVAIGAGLLRESARRPEPWLYARAASELVDAVLIASLGQGPFQKTKALIALAAAAVVAGIATEEPSREPASTSPDAETPSTGPT